MYDLNTVRCDKTAFVSAYYMGHSVDVINSNKNQNAKSNNAHTMSCATFKSIWRLDNTVNQCTGTNAVQSQSIYKVISLLIVVIDRDSTVPRFVIG